ncbi:GntR family transcriptional regulator [Glaciecola siphonariae]|uniref:GntR family transcriptional regulator n=1 Tax=Glaciecola siphonariae TaxID=521012 RepID=A0ABV9LVY0_9ALTE
MKTKVEHIAADIEAKIQAKVLKFGDLLPSLSLVQTRYQVSRDTANRAYRNLKSRGIIESRKGRGYCVANTEAGRILNIFVLLDELSEYKNTLITSFANTLHKKNSYTLFFHHYNVALFEQLIKHSLGNYTHYLISPIPNAAHLDKVLKRIPQHQLMFIDRRDTQTLTPRYVGQAYQQDIQDSLLELKPALQKYERFEFVFGASPYHPMELKTGFIRFCEQHAFKYKILLERGDIHIKKGCAYLIIDDAILAFVVKQAKRLSLRIGEDIGIVSYNETCLKSVIANGITTISSDFEHMGKTLACVLQDSSFPEDVHNPMKVLKRNSL